MVKENVHEAATIQYRLTNRGKTIEFKWGKHLLLMVTTQPQMIQNDLRALELIITNK